MANISYVSVEPTYLDILDQIQIYRAKQCIRNKFSITIHETPDGPITLGLPEEGDLRAVSSLFSKSIRQSMRMCFKRSLTVVLLEKGFAAAPEDLWFADLVKEITFFVDAWWDDSPTHKVADVYRSWFSRFPNNKKINIVAIDPIGQVEAKISEYSRHVINAPLAQMAAVQKQDKSFEFPEFGEMLVWELPRERLWKARIRPDDEEILKVDGSVRFYTHLDENDMRELRRMSAIIDEANLLAVEA